MKSTPDGFEKVSVWQTYNRLLVLLLVVVLVAAFLLGIGKAYAAHGDPAGGGSGYPNQDFVIPT
jgi:hypothetical protein